MNKLIALIVLLLIAGGGLYYYRNSMMATSAVSNSGSTGYSVGNQVSSGSSSTASTGETPTGIGSAGKILFSSTADAANAFLIYPGELTAQAKTAVENFTMKTLSQADGSVQITLTPKDSEEKLQTYIIKSGEKLYFVEKFMGDDSPEKDTNLKDDFGVVVDADGYVVTK
jgi:hypothetical protein